MSKNILLSEKHGVNPSITTCFYCGEATGIALMGKLKDDAEAPRECCMSLEPCDNCKEKYKDYVLAVEKERDESAVPTGRWMAIRKQVIVEEMRNYPVVFMDVQTFNQIHRQLCGGECQHE